MAQSRTVQWFEILLVALPGVASLWSAFKAVREKQRESATDEIVDADDSEVTADDATPAAMALARESLDLELGSYPRPRKIDDQARERLADLVSEIAKRLTVEAARKARASQRDTIEFGEIEYAFDVITGARAEKRAGIFTLNSIAIGGLVTAIVAKLSTPTFLNYSWFWWVTSILAIITVATALFTWPWRKRR